VELGPSAYVWSQEPDASVPYRPDRVTGAFRTLRDRLELQHITFHSLRHFTATTLAAGGVGIRTIAGRLGHANPGITLRTYAHFLDAADREAADALGLALAGLQPASDSATRRPIASSNALRGTTSRRPRRTDGSSRRATRS
jgi:integrase